MLAGLALATLSGCTRTPEPLASSVKPAPASPPEPPMVYYKPGASDEDWQRAKARCLMQGEMAKSTSQTPGDTFAIVVVTCLRADGWVRGPARPTAPATTAATN
jgi:hypothetical protein